MMGLSSLPVRTPDLQQQQQKLALAVLTRRGKQSAVKQQLLGKSGAVKKASARLLSHRMLAESQPKKSDQDPQKVSDLQMSDWPRVMLKQHSALQGQIDFVYSTHL
jgi:hypothetical protein